jgi:hypothetical protein
MNIVQEIEARLLPALERAANEITTEFPDIKAQVYSMPMGSLTDLEGHSLFLSCLFTTISVSQPNEVLLHIGLRDLVSEPLLQAQVTWGYPGVVEFELFHKPVRATPTMLHTLVADLPYLVSALKTVLRRGHPERRGKKG